MRWRWLPSIWRRGRMEIAETRSFVGHIESRTAEHFWIPQYLGFRETMPDFAGGDGKHSRVRK